MWDTIFKIVAWIAVLVLASRVANQLDDGISQFSESTKAALQLLNGINGKLEELNRRVAQIEKHLPGQQ